MSDKLSEKEARAILREHEYGLRHTKRGWFLIENKDNRALDPSPIGPWTFDQVLEFIDGMQREVW